MNIGSPLFGVHFTPASGITPIDPNTIVGRLRVMYYNSPYPQTLNTVSGNPASAGDVVVNVADQYQPDPDFPNNHQDRQAAAEGPIYNPFPKYQNGGLQFDDTIPYVLGTYNTSIQDGIGTFTGYAWGTYDAGSFWIPLGNNSTPGNILVDTSGNFSANADDFTQIGQIGPVTEGKILCRVSYDTDTGDVRIDATGAGGADSTADPGKTSSFNNVGAAIGFDPSYTNSSLLNRYLGSLIYDYVIPFGGTTDLGIRQYIINRFGAGYAL